MHQLFWVLTLAVASLFGPLGGHARAAAAVEEARRSDRHLLFLHASNFSMAGQIYNCHFGATGLKIVTRLGIDALGTHSMTSSESDSIRPKVEGRAANAVGAEVKHRCLSSAILGDPGQGSSPQSPERSIEVLPIFSYDTDAGFGYGAKLFLLGQLGHSESFDFVFFNSTKGERWYKLVISFPDFELRQGKAYPLAADLSIDYDKWIANGFYGIGNMSRYENREVYTREPFEAMFTLSKGFTSTIVGQTGVKFNQVRVFNFGEGSRLTALPIGLYVPKASAVSLLAIFRYDTRNSFLNPSAGVVLQGEVEHAPSLHFSDVSYSRIGGWFQSYLPLPGSKIVCAIRLGLQGLFGNRIPVQFLLPLGGNATLRGSPQDRYLDKIAALGNMELRFPILWRFGGIAGIDAGKVWNDMSKLDLVRWVTNPTIGIRFFMDTFIVRLDVGFGAETTGFYLNFGQIF